MEAKMRLKLVGEPSTEPLRAKLADTDAVIAEQFLQAKTRVQTILAGLGKAPILAETDPPRWRRIIFLTRFVDMIDGLLKDDPGYISEDARYWYFVRPPDEETKRCTQCSAVAYTVGCIERVENPRRERKDFYQVGICRVCVACIRFSRADVSVTAHGGEDPRIVIAPRD
jgi:hypothetical protein